MESSNEYSGKKPWPITSNQVIDGHFYISEILKKKNKTIEEIKKETVPDNINLQLTMEVDVKYKGITKVEIANPIQKHCFDFNKNTWIFVI